jgi:hypothetical protein
MYINHINIISIKHIMTEEQSTVDKSINAIRAIYDKYANDAYMTNRTYHYITEQLPTILDW